MAIIIQNGTIVSGEGTQKADIRIDGEKITQVGQVTPTAQDEVIDATGKYIFPGGIDVHTHLDLDTGKTSTADDFETGTRAAIAGGTTTVIDFATQDKGGTLAQAVEVWNQKAKNAYGDYGFHMAIVDWNEAVEKEMLDMVQAGISSFKLYMAYKGSLQVDDGVIYQALKRAKDVGGLIGFHCENGDLVAIMSDELIAEGKTSPYYHPKSRPDELEEEAINRLCEIALLTNTPVWVVHLSSEKGLRIIEEYKKKGVKVVTETCPQYLVLDDRLYGTEDDTSFEGAKYVISPPLRKPKDSEALWKGIQDGEIDFISTDHCSFSFEQKKLGQDNFKNIPNGGPGLEHRFLLIWDQGVVAGKIDKETFVKLIAQTPSEIFGLENKGAIAVGKDADIVILDPEQKTVISAKTQFQNLDYTPYEGMELSGKIETVFLRGHRMYQDGEFLQKEPIGQFQKRNRVNIG